ncbi:MAG: PepSY domain-containing protein [Pseudomonadota bacterium]
MTDATYGDGTPTAPSAQKFYFIAWRWHFYAGLYVIPFLTMLAVTGLVMLWISWGTGVGAERMAVTPSGSPVPVTQLQTAAEAAVPGGSAVQYIAPLADDRVATFVVVAEDTRTGVALDPYTGEVLQSFAWRAGWYDFANEIHGTLLLGTFGDWMIEIAASLAIVLIASGLYLHWPRNGTGWRKTLIPQFTAKGRAFWKSLHGVVGFWISLLLLVFLISGLSWAGIWGSKIVQAWNTFPAEKWGAPSSDVTHASMNHGASEEVPWGLEQTPMPASGSLAGVAAIQGEVTIDKVAAFADSLAFDGRFQINLPADETGVWTISHDSMSNDGPDPTADRTLHIDRYTGNVLADVQFSDYSPYAKAMAVGIAFHEGDMGVWNLVLNTVFCLSVILVSASGLVMWWKRRPASAARLAAPPRPNDLPFWKGAAVLVVALGVMFPMAGAAILAVLLIDATLLRLMPGMKRAVS